MFHIYNIFFSKKIKRDSLILYNKTNIDLNDEFFQIKEVQNQIYYKNLSYIETIAGERAKVGNALIMVNNLINICEKIRCKNIISPGGGLDSLIKNPIFINESNITIYPNSYKNKIKIDIKLSFYNNFLFRYRKKPHLMKYRILREEIIKNLPNYDIAPEDLYIHIRSGDIFVNLISPNYAQPPLCFYQKIINENNFKKIYLLSNGHENPVLDALLKIYPKIKYIHDSLEGDISLIVNAYNFIMSISTFSWTLILFNNNLKNLYVYEINYSHLYIANCMIHNMKASIKYKNIMAHKWKNSKEQLDLMINENCMHNKIESFFQSK